MVPAVKLLCKGNNSLKNVTLERRLSSLDKFLFGNKYTQAYITHTHTLTQNKNVQKNVAGKSFENLTHLTELLKAI